MLEYMQAVTQLPGILKETNKVSQSPHGNDRLDAVHIFFMGGG